MECFRPIAPASVTAQPDGCRMFFLTQSEHFLAAFSFWCQRRRGVPGEISQSIDFLGFSSLFPPPSLRSQKILEDLHGKQERADKGTLISVLWRVKRGFLFLKNALQPRLRLFITDVEELNNVELSAVFYLPFKNTLYIPGEGLLVPFVMCKLQQCRTPQIHSVQFPPIRLLLFTIINPPCFYLVQNDSQKIFITNCYKIN